MREEIKQPMGLVHGGLYASLAESMTSLATAVAVIAEGKMATGMSNSTSFLRPITEGTVHARAERLHRGRTTWVWDVTFSDDEDRTCAVTRMTIAVRPLPDMLERYPYAGRQPARRALATGAANARARRGLGIWEGRGREPKPVSGERAGSGEAGAPA